MLNRNIFSQTTNNHLIKSQSSKSKQPKPIINQLSHNKINIRKCHSNQSTFRSNHHNINQNNKTITNTISNNNTHPQQLIKIIPQQLHFQSTQTHQLYQIPFYVRNQSHQLQKIRIIPPTQKQFKIKYQDSFINQIAAGLAVKISVLFCSDQYFELMEDKVTIIGNSFKQQIALIAQPPRSIFQFPKVMNIGTLVVKHQKKIQIPIKNTGSKAGLITIQDIKTNDYCPNISYPNKSITVISGKTQMFEINVKPLSTGQIQLKVHLSDMQNCIIRGIVCQDQVQLVDENGLKIIAKDFGQLFIGQKLSWPFYIANSTQNYVDCILQTLNRKKQNADIKIDKKRNIFISQISPQQYSASVQSSCFSLEKIQLKVSSFNSQKNIMYVQKVPSKQQIDIFIQNLTKNIQISVYKSQHPFQLNKSLINSKDPNQLDYLLTGRTNKSTFNNTSKLFQKDKVISQTLAIKFSNQQKVVKIPIKFFTKIPNLQIDINVIQFGTIFVKEIQQKKFTIKNLSNKQINLNFNDSTTAFKQNFKIQGPQHINQNSQATFKIKFRPLIKKKFNQILKIKVFQYFPIEIKIFGECLGLDGSNLIRNQMSLTMTDRKNQKIGRVGNWKSLLKDKTLRQVTDSGNQFTINKSLNKTTKQTQSTNILLPHQMLSKIKKLQKSQDQQIAKMVFSYRQQNMTNEKLTKQNLFFKKQEFLTSTKRNKPFNHPSNLRQLLRYQALSLQELKKVQVQQKKLQFGHIFVGSTTSKKLLIANKLQSPILIQIDTQGAQALIQNSQQPIRLQGYGTYEANIILHPTQLGQLQLPLNYIINKQHVFEVKILAMVTLVNLQLSARSFVFNFSQDDGLFQKQQNLQVYNNGNKKTKFMFDSPQNSSFKLSVLQGQLEPKTYMNIKIMYCPLNGRQSGEQRVDVQKLRMKVHQGAQNIIKCTGSVKQPKISIKQTQFVCQNCIISVPITNKISIKNLSKVQTYIKVEFEPISHKLKQQDIVNFISIDNTVFPLGADQKKEVIFNFLCHEVRKIQLNVILSIRGYKIVKIPFEVNVVYPQIVCLTPQINFQDVPIMSNYCIQMFSLVNATQTQIKLEIDPTYAKDQFFCQILAVKDKNLEFNYEDEKYKTFLNSFLAAFKDNKRLSKRKSIICNKVLTLPPNGQQSVFNVKFIPKCIKKYDFQLPLRIFGSVQKIVKPVNLQVKCNAVDPVIYVEPRAIKFDTKVISQTKSSYSQSIFISNPHNHTVKFKIEPLMRNSQALSTNKKNMSMTSTFNQKFRRQESIFSSSLSNILNFSFSQYEGEIDPKANIQIFVIFKSSNEGDFLQKFNIFLGPKVEEIKSLPNSLSSYILDVSGSAILPTLRFSSNEVIMPVVPLNLQSRIFLMIENHGYDAITICKWKTSNHFPHTEIKVNFVEGKLLSLAKKSLRVEVIFSSLAPISFTTMLQFYDQYGNKYELPLSCTADNSIFTSYPYIQSDNQHTILFNNEQKMIKIIPTGKNSYYQQGKTLSGNHTMSCFFIQKWLNFQLSMNIKTYPETIIESEGKQFVKLINRISSKNLIKKHEFNENSFDQQEQNEAQMMNTEMGISNSKGKISKILHLVELYSETIKKLKQQGAFLNQIRPQFLLNYSQFINYQNHKKHLVCSRSIFDVISTECWITLFYQLCKIYVQPQVTQKILSKIKIQNGVFGQNMTSNLYSTVQILILKFVNYYLTPQQGSSQNHGSVLVNFTQQIKIFEVIQKLLEANFRLSLTNQINSLKNSVSIMSPHVFLSAIAKFLHAQLKQFGLSAYLSSVDLFTIGVKQLVLYLINLLQMIYHYSNATLVKFEGAVGDKITKIIELQNPTGKKVNYFVKIINNQSFLEKQNIKNNRSIQINNKSMIGKSSTNLIESSFIPENTQITIDPKQKTQLKVVYHCKNAKGQTANLYLIPTKQDEDYTIPQPLLFKLTTTILSKIIMKKIIVNTPLYQTLPIHLDIQLPSQIPESSQFSLSLYEQSVNNTQSSGSISFFNPQTFVFNQSHVRTLKQGNKDSLELKLVPLSPGQKICKISYFSSIYGEYIYEIHAKISNPRVLKEFKFKDLKVNIEQQISLIFNKENQLMNSLLKIYYPEFYNYQCKTQKNLPNQGTKRNITSSSKLNLSLIEKASPKDLKYDVQLLQNSYVTLSKGSNSFQKLQKQNKIVLKTHFTKPFKEYSVILSVKNEFLKDRRLYKIIFVVTSPPKIIKMNFKTPARQSITQKIPIKIAPCQISLKTNCDCFIIQSFSRQCFSNTDLVCHFNPLWMQQKQAVIEVQNKQSLQQIIYEISLKADQPQKFCTFELVSSSLFNQQISLPMDVQLIFNQIDDDNKQKLSNSSNIIINKNAKGIYYDIKRLFKRPHSIQCDKFYPYLSLKSVKSFTGITHQTSNNKLNQNNQLFMKQLVKQSTHQKLKIPKTRSLVQQKTYKQINMIFYPSEIQNEEGSIRLIKPNSQQYYWAKVIIKNRSVKKLKLLQLNQKINHSKTQCIDQFLFQQGIDFYSSDFQFKFNQQHPNLIFNFIEIDHHFNQSIKQLIGSNKQKKPCLIFNPTKQIQKSIHLYFKSNNQQFMLPILLKSDPMPTIIVPEITTVNVQPKTTYLNLINGTQSTGTYKVVVQNHDDPNNLCWKFVSSEDTNLSQIQNSKNLEGLTYTLKPKQKKQIRVSFKPKHIHQKEKFILKFQSDTLPNYTYILNGRSQFKVQQQNAQFEVYEDNIKPFHINFSNLFQRKQYFTIQLQTYQNKQQKFKLQEYIDIEEPTSKRFTLEQGDCKGVLLSIKPEYFKLSTEKNTSNSNQNNSDHLNLKFTVCIKVGEKIVKKYNLTLLIIKNLFSFHSKKPSQKKSLLSFKNKLGLQSIFDYEENKKTHQKNKNFYQWSCKARQSIYQTIQIPGETNFFVKQIKCPTEVLKYLTFTCISQNQESSQSIEKAQVNNLKIKYSPMKPIKKKTYDLILIGSKGQKYRLQCQISVDEPEIDDTIIIKTSEIDQIGCVSFKLTNTIKSSAKYKAYFVKKLPQFSIESDHGILQGYGKPGTSLMVMFRSHINNRRLEDRLIVQTEDMYWCFKVKGMLSKDGN